MASETSCTKKLQNSIKKKKNATTPHRKEPKYTHLGLVSSKSELEAIFQSRLSSSVRLRLLQVEFYAENSSGCPVAKHVVRPDFEDVLVVFKSLEDKYVTVAVIVWSFLPVEICNPYYNDFANIIANFGLPTNRGIRKDRKNDCECQGNADDFARY
jgi:hypothetical protein